MNIFLVGPLAFVMVALAAPVHAQTPNLGQLLNNAVPPGMQRGVRAFQSQMDQAGNQAFCNKMQGLLADTRGVPPAVLQRRGSGGGASERMSSNGMSAATQVPYESWFLEDERFIPQFGEAYDAMTPETAQRHARQAAGCRPAPRTIGETAAVDPTFPSRVFNPAYYGRYAQGVKAIRDARAAGEQAVRRLETLSAPRDGRQEYQLIADDAARLKSFMGTAQASRLEAALADAYERVVRPALAGEVRNATAQAQGYDGLVTLTRLLQQTRSGARNGRADDASVAALQARRSALAASLAQEERQQLDALGTGIGGIEGGVGWYKEFWKRYAAYNDIPEIAELERDFERRRMGLLEKNRNELLQRVSLASTSAELDRFTSRYVSLDMDKRSSVVTQLMTRIGEQRDDLDKRRVLGRNAVADAPANRADEPAKPTRGSAPQEALAKGEPSESEMYDLIKKRFDDIAGQARATQEACRGPVRNDDPAQALVCLASSMGGAMGAGEPMKITSFEKLGCERASGKPGYVCDYLLAMSGGVTRAMGPTMAALYGSGGAAQARFLKTRTGWIVFFGKE